MATETINNTNVNPDTIKVAFDKVNGHFTDTSNPHNVTEAQVLSGKEAITTDGSRPMLANLDMGANSIVNIGPFNEDLDMTGHNIKNVNANLLFYTFYIDATTGNDSNSGDHDHPLLTIKAAIDKVPIGGYGVINLSDHSVNTISENITLINKTITIRSDTNDTVVQNVAQDTGDNSVATGLILTGSRIMFSGIRLETTDPISGKPFTNERGLIKIGNFVDGTILLNTCDVILNNSELVYAGVTSALNIIVYGGSITKNATSKLLIIDNSAVKFIANDVTIGSLEWTDLIDGIVYDSNNIPRNIVSNIVL